MSKDLDFMKKNKCSNYSGIITPSDSTTFTCTVVTVVIINKVLIYGMSQNYAKIAN